MLATGVGLLGTGVSTASYAFGIEPGIRLVVQEYILSLPGWGARPPLTICITADIHAGEPWMSLDRVRHIVATANALKPDLHVMLGDLPAHYRFVTRRVPMRAVAEAVAELQAPLGRFAILGNHDWWDDPAAQHDRRPPAIHGLLEQAGVPVLANRAVTLPHGDGVWLLGTDSYEAYGHHRRGADDIAAAVAPLRADDRPAILLAHEPDQFDQVPDRVALTLSGHTHGGQVRLFGYSPVAASRWGNRYAYGLVERDGRRMIVSGGLGCSKIPVRIGVPPELTVVKLT